MTLEIKNCADCPFSNHDNEYGRDCCNLASQLGKDIKLGKWEQLPASYVHKECPLKEKDFLIKLQD